jgi:hypothetical protein
MVIRSLAAGLPSAPSAPDVIAYGTATAAAVAPFKNLRLLSPLIVNTSRKLGGVNSPNILQNGQHKGKFQDCKVTSQISRGQTSLSLGQSAVFEGGNRDFSGIAGHISSLDGLPHDAA